MACGLDEMKSEGFATATPVHCDCTTLLLSDSVSVRAGSGSVQRFQTFCM